MYIARFTITGAGGGAKISTPSSKLGFKVALCEYDRLGGTCLNRGCIPSKMLIHPADVAHEIEHAHRYQNGFSVDFPALVKRVCKTIDEESFSINPQIEKNPNIDWYKKEPAKFVAERVVRVGDTEISADKVFIAAGARPYIPNIPGLKDTPFMTSTEALRQAKQPKKLIVIGGGYIATELAHYFGSLGTEIFMFVRQKMIRQEDEEVIKEFTRVFTSRKRFNVFFGCKLTKVTYQNDEFTLQYQEDGITKEVKADQLLVAAGVIPNSDTLDLDKTGVEVNSKGYIKVDDYLQTTAKNIWAFGDIIGRYLFRHSANFEAEYLMETVIREKESEGKYPIDYIGMPHAIFSYPQVAGVGETEEQLIQRNAKYVKGVNPYKSSAMGMALLSDSGFVKLLIERGTRKILGCHIVGDHASILIHQVIPLMRLNGKLDDLLYMIHIHPAMNEIVRNAARKARDALVAAGDEIPLKLKLK